MYTLIHDGAWNGILSSQNAVVFTWLKNWPGAYLRLLKFLNVKREVRLDDWRINKLSATQKPDLENLLQILQLEANIGFERYIVLTNILGLADF